MRRIPIAFLAVPFSLLLAAGPVAADTSPNGTNFSSDSTTCSTSGARVICTDTNLFMSTNEDGSAAPPCLEVFTYSKSTNGRFTTISDEFGCGVDSSVSTIGADLSVQVASTSISLESCGRRNCTATRTVTVSTNETPTGPITTTTTKSTSTSGGCTTKTTTTDESADLAGTLTVDGTALDATGFVDVFASTETTHCK